MIHEIYFLEEKYNSKLEQKNKVNIKTYLENIYKILFLYKFIQYFEIMIKIQNIKFLCEFKNI